MAESSRPPGRASASYPPPAQPGDGVWGRSPQRGASELSRRALFALGASIVVGACAGDDDGPGGAPSSTASEPPGSTAAPPTASTASTTSSSTSTTAPTTTTTTTTTAVPLPADPFTLGVSAGDPDASSAVLWTRLTGDQLPAEVEVTWELATAESFADVAASGSATASATDAHSLHVVVDLGGPAWYRFRAGGFTSPVGRVAPAGGGAGRLRLASASCQHFETGFYAAHRDLAAWRPDLVVFLGDFIYEGAARPVGGIVVRSHDGDEAVDLAGYRARYAQYLTDHDLQASRACCPWLAIWDDHEVENNYAGVEPQDPAQRDGFAARRLVAYRAWWEHMPVRLPAPVEGAEFRIHRTLSWGELADIVVLDGRQYRDDQACGDAVLSTEPPCADALDTTRTMLGATQEEFIATTFAANRAAWTVVGQQTILSDLRLPNGAVLKYDQWDGYDAARQRLLAAAGDVDRMVVLTGDIHFACVGRLPGIGTEFITASITSESVIHPSLQPLVKSFPAVVDADLTHRGYIRHTVTPETWTAEYRAVDDVTAPDSVVSTWRTFQVAAATPDLPTTL